MSDEEFMAGPADETGSDEASEDQETSGEEEDSEGEEGDSEDGEDDGEEEDEELDEGMEILPAVYTADDFVRDAATLPPEIASMPAEVAVPGADGRFEVALVTDYRREPGSREGYLVTGPEGDAVTLKALARLFADRERLAQNPLDTVLFWFADSDPSAAHAVVGLDFRRGRLEAVPKSDRPAGK